MASPGTDINSGLPIRSEADGTDERVQTKIVDATNPDTQQMEVDTDNNAHVEVHGNDPTGTDTVIRTSEQGSTEIDGVYDVTGNSEPSNVGLVAQTRDVAPGDTKQTERLTSKQNAAGTVRALDISLHDENGEAYNQNNPMPVTLEESEGDEICNYFESPVAIAKGASENHNYTVTVAKTFLLQSVWATASGKMSIEVLVETGAATNVFDTKAVGFSSTANPNIDLDLRKKIKVAAGVRVRVIRTNLDNQPQTLYSTIFGDEK